VSSTRAYEFIDHTFDVVVVGAGGAGLRATQGAVEAGLTTACITKVFPTRSHTVAAQGGIAASLGNLGKDSWQWHMYDTVKGSDWLGDQDAIEYMCRQAVPTVMELEHAGMPLSRSDDGRIYQRPFGGHMSYFGKNPVPRACAAADRTGHALIHTLYGRALRVGAEFFIEYFVLDFIIVDDECRGVIAWSLMDGTLHRFRAQTVILATGGYGRIYFSCRQPASPIHGANRLGCNSLLDIVVFGRAAALRCAEKLTAKAAQPELPSNAGDATLARFDSLRNAKGGTPTPVLRLEMQRAMQTYATVFRTGSILQEGKQALRKVWNGVSDIAVSDRSMIWNSDLLETLEFENLVLQATALVDSAIARTESRGAHAREDFPKRDDQNWMKHTLAWVDPNGTARLDYRPVHTYTLSKDIQYIEPTARVY